MKQIYLKFSMLLLLVVMGLSSAKAQDVTQTVTSCKAIATWDKIKNNLSWNYEKDDIHVFANINYKTINLSGKVSSGTQYTIENESGYTVLIDKVEVEGTGKGTWIGVAGNNSAIIKITEGSGNCNFAITKITITYSYTPVTLNLTSAGYATFCAPYDVTLPDNVQAYTITKSEETATPGVKSLTMNQITDDETRIVSKGTPVVLKGSQISQTYYGVATVNSDQSNENYLKGVYSANFEASAGCYGLQKQGDKVGFYKADSKFGVPQYRAYLNLPSSEGVKALTFGEVTIASSISAASSNTQVSTIFSAAGAKLSNMQKGLNIVKMSDGSVKKVLVK